jgi:hypothetical protein
MRRTNTWEYLLRLALGSRETAARQSNRRPPPRRLCLEPLEDRCLPSTYTAATVSDLIADINAANAAGGSNTITLVAGTTFTLTAVDNTTDGATGLPVIAAKDNLTLAGNGDTLARSTASGTPAFRLLDVAPGGSLTLANLTLQGGQAFGAGAAAEGGALYNQGTLLLTGVTVQNNSAQGSHDPNTGLGQPAAGGGVYSGGALTLQGCTVQNNQALGGAGYPAGSDAAGGGVWSSGALALQACTIQNNQAVGGLGGYRTNGGNGFGGGLYVAGGTATLTNVTLSSNTAQGGAGGDGILLHDPDSHKLFPTAGNNGGNGFGGGLYAAGGTVSLHGSTVAQNTAAGGAGGHGPRGAPNGTPGLGEGGGLYLDAAAAVCLDAFTQANASHNNASTSDNNIHGSYSICS